MTAPGLPMPSLTATVVDGVVTIAGKRGRPVFQPRRCTACGRLGHNVRRCPDRPAKEPPR